MNNDKINLVSMNLDKKYFEIDNTIYRITPE